MRGVVDTSVAIKWFVIENDHERAKALVGQPLIAPDWMLVELTNAVWNKRRLGQMTQEQGNLAQAFVRSFVEVTPGVALVERALEIASELIHPAYDCVFLALSETLKLPLITADVRFIRACADTVFSRHLEPL